MKQSASCQLHWEVHGHKGPYILLVHGFLSSRAQWMPNIEALCETARPVVVELLGHGRSPAPDDPDPYRPSGYIAAFESIRERLGALNWFILGQSLGAGLTLRYAIEYPDKVAAQIFTNTTSGLRLNEDPAREEDASALRGELILKHGRDAIRHLPIHPANARRLRPDVRNALIDDSDLISPLGVANTMRYTLPSVSVRAEIHKNTVPSLLISGRREKRFEQYREFAESRMPLLHVVQLDGGHAVNIDAAEEFNLTATSFIKRLCAR